jgi:hypothetical protein
VLARVEPPALPPHLDLLHVARRIYGARVERCSLTGLERDVLRFERLDDIAGEEIPERYRRYLREGDRAGVVPVVRHNLWDLVALAALTGELAARVARAPSEGRFEADDHVGIARTSLRAGDHAGAIAHAADALSHGQGDASREAHLIAARAHHKTGDALGRSGRLLAALALAPDDPAIHLELARCYERDLDDAHRALEHAHQAHGAEAPSALAKRVQRLTAVPAGRAAPAAGLLKRLAHAPGEQIDGDGLLDVGEARLEDAVLDDRLVGVARHEQHRQARPRRAQPVGELRARRCAAARRPSAACRSPARSARPRAAPRPRWRPPAPRSPRAAGRCACWRARTRHPRRGGWSRQRARRWGPPRSSTADGLRVVAAEGAREVDLEGRADPGLAVDPDVAAALLHDAEDRREPEARALGPGPWW